MYYSIKFSNIKQPLAVIFNNTQVVNHSSRHKRNIRVNTKIKASLHKHSDDGENIYDILSKQIQNQFKLEQLNSDSIKENEKLTNGEIGEDEYVKETAYLVGVKTKSENSKMNNYDINASLNELESLAETAGLKVIGRTHQYLDKINPATYIGSGKIEEIKEIVQGNQADTVIFDEELSPVQLMNLEKEFKQEVRTCDRTALILDIFMQRAMSKEGKLQVDLAVNQYQLPRLTRMWTHLERQTAGASGAVKGMGEKQIEVDKRLIRHKIGTIKKELEEVKLHRRLIRNKRTENHIPTIALVGYTNSGKSSLMNKLSNADVMVEDKLFATLDPITRKIQLPSGKEALITDTVGFIQKIPTKLIVAFRATLEELCDATLLLHVVDISHPKSKTQANIVLENLKEIGADNIPILTVWNKIDKCENINEIIKEAVKIGDIVCTSVSKGICIDELLNAIENVLEDGMVPMSLCIPYKYGDYLDNIHSFGIVKSLDYDEEGALIKANIPVQYAERLQNFEKEF